LSKYEALVARVNFRAVDAFEKRGGTEAIAGMLGKLEVRGNYPQVANSTGSRVVDEFSHGPDSRASWCLRQQKLSSQLHK